MTLRHALASASLATLVTLAACGGTGGDAEYANDGDTGAAAPATVQDTSATPNVGDSTTGARPLPGNYPTSTPAGDTLHGTGRTGAVSGGAAGAAGGASGTQTPRP